MALKDKGVIKRAIVTPDKHFPLHDVKSINILCKTINNQQYLEQVHYFLDKNLKEISKKYDKTNCNKNAEINIKSNN